MERMIETYLSRRLGYSPAEEDYNKLYSTCLHLRDNNYTNAEILKILLDSNKDLPEDCEMTALEKTIVTGEQLPDYLWDNSLLEKGKYYYNNKLHICSKAPTWNPKTMQEECEPFFMEMKIKFTIQDLLELFYKECRTPVELRVKSRDEGALQHLLNKYNKMKAPGVDYLLLMIDLANKDNKLDFLTNPFELENYSKEAFIILEEIVEESTLNKSNVITWRTHNAM